MTAEERCEVCKDLIEWSKSGESWQYMEERIYAVDMGHGRVMLLKAKSYLDALEGAYQ